MVAAVMAERVKATAFPAHRVETLDGGGIAVSRLTNGLPEPAKAARFVSLLTPVHGSTKPRRIA